MYIYIHSLGIHNRGVQWEGVQWMGVVLHNKLIYNIIQITTPCFHCHPPLMNLERCLSDACPRRRPVYKLQGNI